MIHFDDSLANTNGGIAYAISRGVKGTMYTITDLIGTAGYLTAVQLAAMDAGGWDVANHSRADATLAGRTVEDVSERLTTAQVALEALGFTRASQHVAYPAGAYDANVLTAMTNTGMLTGRRTAMGYAAYPMTNLQIVPIALAVTNAHTLADVQKVLTDAMKAQLCPIVLFHGLADAAPTMFQWLNSDFQALVDWLVANNIPTATISELYGMS